MFELADSIIFSTFQTICIKQAHDLGMFGKKYQWLTVSTLNPTWWHKVEYIEPQNCTEDQYLKAAQGYISIANTNLRSDDVRNAGGLVCISFNILFNIF